jgi:hypothetical protein
MCVSLIINSITNSKRTLQCYTSSISIILWGEVSPSYSTDLGSASPPPILTLTITVGNAKLTLDNHLICCCEGVCGRLSVQWCISCIDSWAHALFVSHWHLLLVWLGNILVVSGYLRVWVCVWFVSVCVATNYLQLVTLHIDNQRTSLASSSNQGHRPTSSHGSPNVKGHQCCEPFGPTGCVQTG